MGHCLGKEKSSSSKKGKQLGPAGGFRLDDDMERESLVKRSHLDNLEASQHRQSMALNDENIVALSEPLGLHDSSEEDTVLPSYEHDGLTRSADSSDERVDMAENALEIPATTATTTSTTTTTATTTTTTTSTTTTLHPSISSMPDKPTIIRFGLGAKKKKRSAHSKPFPLESQVSSEELSYSSIREELRNHPDRLNDPTHSPKLLRAAVPPQLPEDFQRYKSSSTSTLFINTTIKAPDNEEIVRCMSVALYWIIKKNENRPKKPYDDIWSEARHPLDDNYDLVNSPDQQTVFKFLNVIFKRESLSAECGVMCMAYIDRLNALTGVPLVAATWRRVVLGALIIASKVWEDQAVWNVDFLHVFPLVSVSDLNALERAYLNALQFNVSLKASVYAKYYFELRSLSEKDASHFPLKPLDKEGAERLEQRSSGLEKKEKRRLKRSVSADQFRAPTVPVSLPT